MEKRAQGQHTKSRSLGTHVGARNGEVSKFDCHGSAYRVFSSPEGQSSVYKERSESGYVSLVYPHLTES